MGGGACCEEFHGIKESAAQLGLGWWARQQQEFMELHSGAPAPSARLWGLVHSFLLRFFIPPPQQMTFSTGLLVLLSPNIDLLWL